MDLEALVARLESLAQKAEAQPVVDTAAIEASVEAKVTSMVDAALAPIKSAFEAMQREGLGRKAQENPAEEFESSPVEFLVKKGDAESHEEKAVAVAVFKQLADGMLA